MEERILKLEAEVERLAQNQKNSGSVDSFDYDTIRAIKARFPNFLYSEATLNFPSTNSGSSNTLTITVPGARLGDCVALGIPYNANGSGIIFMARVSATDIVSIEFHNQSAGTQDLDSALFFKVFVIQNQ